MSMEEQERQQEEETENEDTCQLHFSAGNVFLSQKRAQRGYRLQKRLPKPAAQRFAAWFSGLRILSAVQYPFQPHAYL